MQSTKDRCIGAFNNAIQIVVNGSEAC